jgi:arginine decarboxylase
MRDVQLPLFRMLSPADSTPTPLLTALQIGADRADAAFHTPGHQRGQGAPAPLLALMGDKALRADLPELPELDNLFAPQGVIQQAQELAAVAFGADRTWFLANGSTSGVMAAILATCDPGDTIVVPRNSHQSVIAGIILAGANPVFVVPEYDAEWDLVYGVTAAAIAQTLVQYPAAKAVLVVSPTYHGVCSDIQQIAAVTHRYGIPLIVDEAHGAHFQFHSELPLAALAAGADVAIQSTHKTLSALTQAAMLHLRGGRVNADRIGRSLALVQSTSPNYLLLASLDAARQQMAIAGQPLLTQTLRLVDQVIDQLGQLPGIRILQLPPVGGLTRLDRTRLTINVAGLGITGFTADAILTEQFGVICELPSLRHLTFIFSIGTTPSAADRLTHAIAQLTQQQHPPEVIPVGVQPTVAETVMSPRAAFFATARTVPIAQAIGQTAAELVCPYPPGIPVLWPGERITAAAIAYLQVVQRSGGVISGCLDPTLATMQVVA